MFICHIFVAALLFRVAFCAIPLSLSPPENASQPLLESFVSFSIEFSSFPDFAGKFREVFLEILFERYQGIRVNPTLFHTTF